MTPYSTGGSTILSILKEVSILFSTHSVETRQLTEREVFNSKGLLMWSPATCSKSNRRPLPLSNASPALMIMVGSLLFRPTPARIQLKIESST